MKASELQVGDVVHFPYRFRVAKTVRAITNSFIVVADPWGTKKYDIPVTNMDGYLSCKGSWVNRKGKQIHPPTDAGGAGVDCGQIVGEGF